MLIYGADLRVFEFVHELLPEWELPDPALSVGIGAVNRRFELIAGVAYTNYRSGISVEMTVAGNGAHWLTRGNIAGFLEYPFRILNGGQGVQRITNIVAKKNKRSRQLTEWIGYKREGCCRRGMPSGDDAIIYGLLPEEAERHLKHLDKTRKHYYGQERAVGA